MANDTQSPWWKTMVLGIACLAVAIIGVVYFPEADATLDPPRRATSRIFHVVYLAGGKWAVFAVFALPGLWFIYAAIKDLRKSTDT